MKRDWINKQGARVAVIYAAILNFIGALLFSAVAKNIVKGIPFIAFAGGYMIMYIVKGIVFLLGNGSPSKFNRNFRSLQIITAGLQSFAHGTNDAQKTRRMANY